MQLQTGGTLTLHSGGDVDYILLSSTFGKIDSRSTVVLVEFWQEPNKHYLTGIKPKSSPPVDSKFKFTKCMNLVK